MSQKSHTNLVNEVSSWTSETCLKNVHKTLPLAFLKCLLSNINGSGLKSQARNRENIIKNSSLIAESIGVLRMICHSLLSCLSCEELENKVFSKLCPSVTCLINNIAEKLQSSLKNKQNEVSQEVVELIAEHLECFVDVGQIINHCVKFVTVSSVDLTWVQSLPTCATGLLLQAYTHCRDSSLLYGDLLNQFSEKLSALFKTAHSLQMSLLGLLEKICITGSPLEDHVITLTTVCRNLHEICCVVSTLDVKLVIGLLRGISRLCSQHLSLLQDRLDVSPIINYICQEISQGYQYLFQLCTDMQSDSLSQGDEKAFTKLLKVLGFQMKVMVALLRDFSGYLDNCEKNVYNLLLCFHRLLPPSLSSQTLSEKQTADIKTHLVNATAPILSHLMTNKAFREELTIKQTKEVPSEDSLPKLLLQIMVLDTLPKYEVEIMDSWLMPTQYPENVPTMSILAAIFYGVDMCETEIRYPVLLPGGMVAGKAQRQVSLYEHVATHVCGYIGACRARHFNSLESTLLENVVGGSTICSLLAADCWCFLARYGTANLCRDQVHSLVKIYFDNNKKGSPNTNKVVLFRLKCLLRRLIKLMAKDHQKILVEFISTREEHWFWTSMTPDCLHENICSAVRQNLLTWSINLIQMPQAKASELFVALDFLIHDLSNTGSSSGSTSSTSHHHHLMDFVSKMSSSFNQAPNTKSVTQEKLASRLVLLAKGLLQQLPTYHILQVLCMMQKNLEEEASQNFRLSVVHFLGAAGKLRVKPYPQQSQVLDKLAKVFHQVLCDPDPLVHHAALSAFADFAAHTVYETTIPACIQGEVWLQQRVETFLNKCPYKSARDVDLLHFLRSRVSSKFKVEDNQLTHPDIVDEETETLRDCEELTSPKAEPPSKKVKTDEDVRDHNLHRTISSSQQCLLQRMTSLADDLENECSKCSLCPEFIEAAKLAVTRINDCLVPSKSWFDCL